MGAMIPPSRKSCYNLPSYQDRQGVGRRHDRVTIDLGFDLYKKERVRLLEWTPSREEDERLRREALGIDATNWLKG